MAFAHNLYCSVEGWPLHIQETDNEEIVEITAALRIEGVQNGYFWQE